QFRSERSDDQYPPDLDGPPEAAGPPPAVAGRRCPAPSHILLLLAARGGDPQPPVPQDAGATGPDVRLVRDPHPLLDRNQCVWQNALKSSLATPSGGRYLVVEQLHFALVV